MRALLHAVSARLPACELTFAAPAPIDVAIARAQHAAYAALLRRLGVAVTVVDVSPDHADSVFVEDTAVVLDELAILAAMGAASRHAEVTAIRPLLTRWRRTFDLPAGAHLEGGDVLRCDRDLFVGRSTRTDQGGIDALRTLVAPFGYRVHAVEVARCLHLKTAVTAVGDGVLLANPDLVDVRSFGAATVLAVPRAEPNGANALRIGSTVCLPTSQPATAALLRAHGLTVAAVDIGELEKAEAGMTCLCLLFA